MDRPLTSRIVFPPEPKVERRDSLTCRRIWAPEPLPYLDLATSNSREKIPKPRGELGRPGRGGYILRQVLGWDETFYKTVQNSVSKQVRSDLPFLPFTEQNATKIQETCLKQFSDAESNVNCSGLAAPDENLDARNQCRPLGASTESDIRGIGAIPIVTWIDDPFRRPLQRGSERHQPIPEEKNLLALLRDKKCPLPLLYLPVISSQEGTFLFFETHNADPWITITGGDGFRVEVCVLSTDVAPWIGAFGLVLDFELSKVRARRVIEDDIILISEFW
ncbi:hypothetical protein Hypma_015653 [Hypsizygus marmoreus]|uniref:Uncharacterized protein n=1 Tax=Hypsizygus marmoreus TaxID=39966 RepID=A0A369KCX5_HYPMA|nr:hypothetical protein Hypma_015653 [Hypsizygus marmoreus]